MSKRKTNLQTAVSVAEIVSALAIVVTLLYVAGEFRHSRTLSSTDVQTLVYDRMLEMDRLVIENPDLAGILVVASEDPEALSPEQRVQFLAYEHIFYDSWETAWTAYREDVLEESAWTDWSGWFGAEAARRPRFGWSGNRKNHGEDFAAFVESQLRSR